MCICFLSAHHNPSANLISQTVLEVSSDTHFSTSESDSIQPSQHLFAAELFHSIGALFVPQQPVNSPTPRRADRAHRLPRTPVNVPKRPTHLTADFILDHNLQPRDKTIVHVLLITFCSFLCDFNSYC